MNDASATATAGIVTILFFAAIYFIPFAIAKARGHDNATGIGLLNLFLGWTILGWIISLVWASTGKPTPAGPTPETHAKCPDCRELVLIDARKCKHCGCALIPLPGQSSPE